MDSGPRAMSGFDIALTARVEDILAFCLAEARPPHSAECLAPLNAPAGRVKERHAPDEMTAREQTRALNRRCARNQLPPRLLNR
jgi:hypothetical protein